MAIQNCGFGLVALIFQILVLIIYNLESSVSAIEVQGEKEIRSVPIPGPRPTPSTTTTTTTTPATTTRTTTTATPNSAGNKEINANQNALEYINRVRMSHNASPLIYDSELQALARSCARLYALQVTDDTVLKDPLHDTFKFQCNREQTRGGNELLLTTRKTEAEDPGVFRKTFTDWYNEPIVKDYKYQDPVPSTIVDYQQFTQMMWKGSTKMGCACEPKSLADPPRCVCSCIFTPPGNTRFGYSSAGLVDYITNVQDKK